jgi:hypothetical protein
MLRTAELHADGEGSILVCDLEPGVWSIKRNNSEVNRLRVSEEGHCLYFQALPGKYSIGLVGR